MMPERLSRKIGRNRRDLEGTGQFLEPPPAWEDGNFKGSKPGASIYVRLVHSMYTLAATPSLPPGPVRQRRGYRLVSF
jgi:hypothetical protein